ncbi:MAG: helix-hairpin-helix domain-containing protein [Proteobacteria bacterium]|nr:helix-hairpin-helix domain-containing protein [Pseudomonadota bacterium]
MMKKNPKDKRSGDSFFKQVILLIAFCSLLGLYSYRHYFSVERNPGIQTGAASSVVMDFSAMTADEKILHEIPLDLNNAKPEELMKISGIGIKLSKAIVDYKDKHGYFSNIEELKEVKGIGEKKFRKIEKYLTVMAVSEQK